jgi:hypothetical protein
MASEGLGFRALTIRLTPERHEAATRLAQQLGVSLNHLVQQALDELITLDREMALFRAASILGEHSSLEERTEETRKESHG